MLLSGIYRHKIMDSRLKQACLAFTGTQAGMTDLSRSMKGYRKKFGEWGEDIAVQYLVEKGFTILMRNFRAERGEIDIIAREGDYVVFVEVKTGNSDKFGPPEERITRSKQRQLYKIASHFIQQNPELEVDYRFDAVIIDGHPGRYEIRHYPNAFYL